MTLRRLANNIVKHITGAAVMPLMMADHTKALMGSIFVKFVSVTRRTTVRESVDVVDDFYDIYG